MVNNYKIAVAGNTELKTGLDWIAPTIKNIQQDTIHFMSISVKILLNHETV